MAKAVHSLWWAAGAGVVVSACSAQGENGGTNGAASGTTDGATNNGDAPGSGNAPDGSPRLPPSDDASGNGDAGIEGPDAGDGASGNGDTMIEALDARDGALADQESGSGARGADAGCAQNSYPVCMDFESLPDPKWTGIGANVQMGKAAHGNAAFHGPPGSTITTTSLGPITNVLWGRFYLHMTPKAPVGHGAMVMLFDQPGRSGNWYEVGFEFNALQGNWHGNGGEKYMRTKMLLPDKWACVEFFADGANAAPIKLWMDSIPIVYSDVASSPSILKTTKFANFTIGMTPYHGLSTVNYEGNVMPMTDMWIDDIALDTQRVGCIAN